MYEEFLTEDEKRERYDKYQLTGDFEKDFLHLASLIEVKVRTFPLKFWPPFNFSTGEDEN